MKEKIRILCVGIGGYAAIYLKALLQEKPRADVEIVGMVDVMPENSPFYATLCGMGVPLYRDMEDFYAEHDADLAIITTPTHLHTRQILCALAHGSTSCARSRCPASPKTKMFWTLPPRLPASLS